MNTGHRAATRRRRERPQRDAGRRTAVRVFAVLALLSAAAGCGDEDYSGGPTDPGASASSSALPPLPRSQPATIAIPRLKVSAPVTDLGLQADGRIEEPPLSRPNLAGWWKKGPTPGEGGPAVILGHVDAMKKPAVFYRLKELKPGDRVRVTRKDGKTATFAVERVERVSKDSFPGEKVYGEDIDYAALRLVTCGGTFDPGTGHYRDNVIAYTRMVRA
ncbi:class F sortase [Actinomadura hibisca]|uniref:class F sortase n=1 Tax=Actinomadura hibisca TaxID=68565 RepID=UPI000831CAC1|nr:class F sortase [Actinomadura hibisca]